MTNAELKTITASVAHPKGFCSGGNLFWKSGADVTLVLELQASRWGPGTYINYGFIPTEAIDGTRPPSSEYWGLACRAESTSESPYWDLFRAIALGQYQDGPEMLAAAMTWLIDWMARHLSDPAQLKAAIRDPSSWMNTEGRATAVAKRWAGER